MRRWLYLLPVILFALVAAGFYFGLDIDPNVLPSALIDEKAPQFALPALPGRDSGLSTADLQGHVSLVNTFASWCGPCRLEHPLLLGLASIRRVPIYGINYKDEGAAANAWIKALGDPYTKIGADDGRVGLDWGVYGVPETFVIDRTGHIRYKHVGPLTEAVIRQTIIPLVSKLEK
jgi:cytochrome c biogenesis protein CcmG/thiol:disulfide interchange protein DsbE